MKSVEELNAYLYALSLVNSSYKDSFRHQFKIDCIEKKASILESISYYEKSSADFDGYDKEEYKVLILPDGFEQLTTELNELFSNYLNSTIQHARLNLHVSEVKYMKSALSDSIRENLLSESFVRSLKKLVGSDATVFSIEVDEQEPPNCWSVFDLFWGEVYLIWGERRAYILEISGHIE